MSSSLSVYIEIEENFKKETIYTFENLFHPFFDKIIFFDELSEFTKAKNKIIYCMPESKVLNDANAIEKSVIIL